MSDYWPDSEGDELPLFRKSIIVPHEIPDLGELEKKLINALRPHGTPKSIEWLRLNLYSRVETVARRLRENKHVIDTIDGCYIYRHGPPIGWVRVPKSLWEIYRKTQHWRTVSAQRIELDGCCTLCRRVRPDVKLNAHHWRYNLFNEDILRDLQTFCDACHRTLHMDIRGSGVFFPKVLEQATIDRIKKEGGQECS